MEQNEEVYYENVTDRKKDCFCQWLILTIVAIALSFFVGVLVGALTGIFVLFGLGGIIALIIALLVLLVIAIINVICCKKKNKKKYCC